MNTILRRLDPFSHNAMPYRTAVRWTSVLLLATLGGCNGLYRTDQSRRPEDNLRDGRGALREALHQFEKDFRNITAATSKEVLREPTSEEPRQLVESWRSRITQECNTAIRRDDPVRGLLDVWMLCRRARNHFQSGESTAVLGKESQQIVLDAAERTHNWIERIARDYSTEEGFQRMSQKVAEYAGKNPIPGTFADEPSFSVTDSGKTFLKDSWAVLKAPLGAVDDLFRGAVSLSGLPGAVDRFSDVIDTMPRKVREEAEVLLDRVDKSQPEWGATVVEVRETVQSFERTVEGVPKAAQALETLAAAIGRAKKEIGTLWSTPDGRGESAPPESKEPFSLQEVTESAEAVTLTVAELRGLVQELRNLIESDSLAGETNAIGARFDSIGREMRGVVTHAGKWGVLLTALLFVCMLLYRAITNRFLAAHPAT